MRKVWMAMLVGAGITWGSSAEELYRIQGVESVQIPAGLSNAQALDAVQRTATGVGNWLTGRWGFEARDVSNQWIRVVLNVRRHSLTVCYRVENGALVPDVPHSTNLNQVGSKIDDHVPGWINRFNNRVRTHFATPASSVPAATPAVSPAPAAQPAAATARFCEGCGKKVSPDANFCGSCGRKLK